MSAETFRSLVRIAHDLETKQAERLREVERACEALRRLSQQCLNPVEHHGRQEALQRRLTTALNDLAETIMQRLDVRAEIEAEPLHAVTSQPGTRH